MEPWLEMGYQMGVVKWRKLAASWVKLAQRVVKVSWYRLKLLIRDCNLSDKNSGFTLGKG